MKTKQVFAESLKTDVFFRWKLGEEQKKKVFAETRSVFSSESLFRGIWCCIRPDFVGLFPLINQRSNLDGGRLNLDGGGDAQSRWGDAQARWGDASPPSHLQFKYWL